MSAPGTVEQLLGQLIAPGALVIDVGAHQGAKCERYLGLGASVVCVEPLPACARELRARFGGDPRVTVVEQAAGAKEGAAVLSICSRAPYLSTLSAAWKRGRFRDEVWDREVEVGVTTLDALIARHGLPVFCKIDVEGHERDVLAGLSTAIAALSIEFAREAVEETGRCLTRLGELGYRRFNLAFGEGDRFALGDWVEARDIVAAIATSADPLAWGDVYAASAGV